MERTAGDRLQYRRYGRILEPDTGWRLFTGKAGILDGDPAGAWSCILDGTFISQTSDDKRTADADDEADDGISAP